MLQHVIPHGSTMIVHFPKWDNKEQTRFSDQGISDKEQLKCDYCRRTKHTRETYWNFMDVLPGDMEEKGLAYPITSSHVSGD
jgi:hypothetical protein